eukprot:TRINITY_DN10738_c0_g1_i1.p1 TRINITY_DN10738_c0_g1~~TRINITY_DN10738_c0_g1_i1.p1  ORF type:complete len:640 (+),score=174.28 TRINITY_DN10738_c0_g1_i1:126-2045(+)
MAPLASGGSGGLDGLDGLDGLGLDGAGASLGDEYLPCFEDLTPFEVEHFVQDLKEFELEEVGGTRWLTQHERIEKLNWTAHNQAKDGLDEFVVDQINTLEKGPQLVYDLILIELWKDKIWPLVKSGISKFSSLRTYIPVYHEASICNLIEICLFHRTTCEEMGDALVDLVDFCVRKLRHLLATPNSELVRQVGNAKEYSEWDSVRCLDEQFVECEFQVCMCVISILRFLTDHRVAMPLAVTTRLLDTHDVLLLLVPLMEKAPWVRKNKNNGRIEKFEDHKWERVEDDDAGRLPKLHTQVWLAIYNLVMDQECRSRYELTSFRKENLLRLRRFINEVVVDQLPPLTNLHRTLEEMAISGQFTGASGPPAGSPFVVELVAEARETLLRSYDGRWQEVADHQLKEVLVKETPDELRRLGDMISVPKELFDEPPPQELPSNAGGGLVTECGGSSGSSAPRATAARTSAAWDALLAMPLVQSTASFYAAVGAADAPSDEVIVLSVASEPAPAGAEGPKLQLELRRARSGQLAAARGADPRKAAAEALVMARKTAAAEGDGAADPAAFLLATESPDGTSAPPRQMAFVSQKGASKTAKQLRSLLEKPGRESLRAMYAADVAEFSVPIGGPDGCDAADAACLRPAS